MSPQEKSITRKWWWGSTEKTALSPLPLIAAGFPFLVSRFVCANSGNSGIFKRCIVVISTKFILLLYLLYLRKRKSNAGGLGSLLEFSQEQRERGWPWGRGGGRSPFPIHCQIHVSVKLIWILHLYWSQSSSSPSWPGVLGTRAETLEALCETSETVVGDIPLELGGVLIPHTDEGLHMASFIPEDITSEPCHRKKKRIVWF